jgi:hypothetical protein
LDRFGLGFGGGDKAAGQVAPVRIAGGFGLNGEGFAVARIAQHLTVQRGKERHGRAAFEAMPEVVAIRDVAGKLRGQDGGGIVAPLERAPVQCRKARFSDLWRAMAFAFRPCQQTTAREAVNRRVAACAPRLHGAADFPRVAVIARGLKDCALGFG